LEALSPLSFDLLALKEISNWPKGKNPHHQMTTKTLIEVSEILSNWSK